MIATPACIGAAVAPKESQKNPRQKIMRTFGIGSRLWKYSRVSTSKDHPKVERSGFRSIITNMLRSALTLFALSTATTFAADWEQFQGPRGDGSSPETGLLREWPTNGPPVEWRVP